MCSLNKKLFTIDSFKKKLSSWKRSKKRIVFTNGCFDILHKGHIELLANASNLGDKLIIGLNSDHSIQKLKGLNRPVLNQESRTILLASLIMVDAIILFDEDTPYDLIEHIMPDILVKGGDYEIDKIIGSDIIKQHGGEVILIPFLDGYSTTSIVNKIKGI